MTDRSLTDPATLRRLAEAATPGPWSTLRQRNTYWAVIIRDDTPLLNNANECDAGVGATHWRLLLEQPEPAPIPTSGYVEIIRKEPLP